ncbi:tRNA (guanosine(37)-N1)-methyltransferase TrmD [Mycoplasma feriruminatoris]|uniref:tRNA (guanine-N(1)-)-methyltransferase n=1 Tax=Mycoplasma feriruminatoris TaxID=1179777 RepID=A0AAQ3DNH2_9MOLU|nr:tRNA (guanosine(37)-N1)-methyltransferase TrmD [Mycoplasma feriruminatoris]UKS54189.1 tRNA (guanine(37)-N(1))-methyltransferase [Mycoplasma feriruminatoris]WFQ90247.1 tRNA (guanine-N(1)-)-methyltransferase [Mycoplasma feriruminatoris]WFQ91070.1 tRNA (guanine-N(1)-)-methyltransferase [Mycoplasma feriruminatoris]WFQ91892.1 tRNA (guanine-N(1)-)-methyltransferase [Mycoplasma feriruminatoris]WFQ92732.1 tRNA (guanine-N(1)-)-methyltransferase [Mycoplasma feriruminatoris]
MKFSIITLFPKIINSYIEESIIKRAIIKQAIQIEVIDLRDFSTLSHNQVDDYQYGGGSGMVLMIEPLIRAIESIKTDNSIVLLTTPQGKTLKQPIVKSYANNYEHIIIICGHYEGYDERILDYIDDEVSIGDYVITGGELASLILVDSISRILPNVIKQESHENESFENNLLDHPVYTKPYEFRNKKVPDVLLSGHHQNIKKWREAQQVIKTLKKRPDLIDETKLNKHQLEIYKKMKGEQ